MKINNHLLEVTKKDLTSEELREVTKLTKNPAAKVIFVPQDKYLVL